MAQIIHLKQLRMWRGLTQAKLADGAHVDKQTVYRLEKKEGKVTVHPRTFDGLAQTLRVDPEVLTGEKPIPSDASQPSAAADEATTYYQLNVRMDAALRNAFELVARRYRVSVPKITQLAPLLFFIVAEASLKRRRKNLEDLRKELEEHLYGFDNISNELQEKFPHIPFPNIDWDDQDEAIEGEEKSIKSRDLFGEKRIDDVSRGEAFADYLKALTADDDDITITALDPTSTEYRLCRSEAIRLAGNDEEVAEWLLRGEVPIHQIPRGLTKVEDRIEWMRTHRISPHKLPEEVVERFPEEPDQRSIGL